MLVVRFKFFHLSFSRRVLITFVSPKIINKWVFGLSIPKQRQIWIYDEVIYHNNRKQMALAKVKYQYTLKVYLPI